MREAISLSRQELSSVELSSVERNKKTTNQKALMAKLCNFCGGNLNAALALALQLPNVTVTNSNCWQR